LTRGASLQSTILQNSVAAAAQAYSGLARRMPAKQTGWEVQ
jgi:hypothetical protein